MSASVSLNASLWDSVATSWAGTGGSIAAASETAAARRQVAENFMFKRAEAGKWMS
jgi:hypothetical protein